LPAFAEDLSREVPLLNVEFTDAESVFSKADLLIASGSDSTIAAIRERCDLHGIPESHTLLRGHGFGVAILTGKEGAEERSGLAEDMLLHEGRGCRSVALVWAPRNLSPDPYLDMMAQLRGVFPPSKRMEGSLSMQEAFLAATGISHAVGPGFLMSRGDPEPQPPGHIRWSEYDTLDDVSTWLEKAGNKVQVVVASKPVRSKLPDVLPLISPGDAQRPALDWQPGGLDTMAFLRDNPRKNTDKEP
jgi:hypothetical protein